MTARTAPQFTFKGTYAIDVRPVRPGDAHGTLILHGDNPDIEGVICYCRPGVACYAHTLTASGDTPAGALDHHGNVASVQTAEGLHRVEFPGQPESKEG